MTNEVTEYFTPSQISTVARDVCLLADIMSPAEVASFHNLDEYEFYLIRNSDIYKSEYNRFVREAQQNPVQSLKQRARVIVDYKLPHIARMVDDPGVKSEHQLKAMAFLRDIADVLPRRDDTGSGIVVNIDFGKTVGKMQGKVLGDEGDIIDV